MSTKKNSLLPNKTSTSTMVLIPLMFSFGNNETAHVINKYATESDLNINSIRGTTIIDCIRNEQVLSDLFKNPEFTKHYEEAENKYRDELKDKLIRKEISPIKYYRIINNMTQVDLANAISDVQPNISRLEKKKYINNLPVDTVSKLAKVFKITIEELIDGY